jgi:tetratricopeptide (TPR) repeat protein
MTRKAIALTILIIGSLASPAVFAQSDEAKRFVYESLETFRQAKFKELLVRFDEIKDNKLTTLAKGLAALPHVELGNNEKALQTVNEAIGELRDDPWQQAILHCCKSYALARQGFGPEALAEAETAVELASDEPLTHYIKGRAHLFRGENNEALSSSEASLALDPEFAMAVLQRALANSNLWKRDEAMDGFAKAMELDPDYVTGAWIFAMELTIDGKFAQANELLNAAEKVTPDYSAVFGAKSLLGELSDDAEMRIENAEKAFRLNEKSIDALFTLVSSLIQDGELEKALKHAETAIELHPNNYHSHMMRARIYSEQKKFIAAISELRKAAELNPTHASPPYAIGFLSEKMGSMEVAINAYQAAKKLNPRKWFSAFALGQIYASQGEHRKAIQEFDDALSVVNDFGLGFAERAKSYEETGDSAAAEKDFATAKSLGWTPEK